MKPLYAVAWPIVWLISKLFFFLGVKGKKNMPKTGPVVVCANHVHALDPLALAMICHRQIHFMSKYELFQKKFTKWLLTALGAFPVNREGNDLKAMKKSMEILKQGRVLGIFPEGTRSKTGGQLSFHEGAVTFALRCGAALVPVGMNVCFKPFRKHRVVVGEPIDLSAYQGRKATKEEITKVNRELEERVMALTKQAKGQ